jgi:Protein of unknown function (DUF4038)/Putative collagen-binding domain of a collagenase
MNLPPHLTFRVVTSIFAGRVRGVQITLSKSVIVLAGLVTILPSAVDYAWNSSGARLFDSALTVATGTPAPAAALNPHARNSTTAPAYPLKVSANNRYLVDQNNVPFMIVGDSPQALIGNLSESEAAVYIVNRAGYGINTLWINLLCNKASGCHDDATTFDGIAPFTTAGDLSTPNPAYFQRVDAILKLAAASGIVVMVDPIETNGWINTLRANGRTKARWYGEYIGTRYKDFTNIIWLHGNDFQSWQNAPDDDLVLAVALGIASKDPNHIQTVELDFLTSASLDDTRWEPLIGLDAVYTYYPTYAQVLNEYNRALFKPVFVVEANYEFEHNSGTDGGSTQNLRKQEYWAMLCGATGQLYGSLHTWLLASGWRAHLDTTGAAQLSYMKALFAPRRWYELIPDQQHTVVTAGYGTFSPRWYVHGLGRLWRQWLGEHGGSLLQRITEWLRTALGPIDTDTYATAARTADGTLVILYIPTIRTITVDMSKLAAPALAHWFDPSNGSFKRILESPFANSGSKQFTPPGKNGDGDGDWVLVLESP